MLKKTKKILVISAILCAMSTSVYGGTLDNFTVKNKYEEQFKDVETTKWYANDVKKCYELGLMKGRTETRFKPGENVTIAEAITMASRVHNIYNNGAEAKEIEQQEGKNGMKVQ